MGRFKYICFLLACLCFLQVGEVEATKVTGYVKAPDGTPLAFANVYVKGTTEGTTTNASGKYVLDLSPGSYVIVFKYIGYKMESRAVRVEQQQVILNVTMQPASIRLGEVVVSAGEDPAYDIIRNAIKMREYYLEFVKSFSCKVYAKGKVRMEEVPQNYLAKRIEVDSTKEGIVYLSESVSRLYYQYPDKKKEEMISSKVSGSNQGISFNFIFNRQFSFYENMLDFQRVAPRGIVSPIANNAMLYYDYRLKGKFREHGETINKIKVIPKRDHDPVFQGYIYIVDSTWRIHSVDLLVTQDHGIEVFDSITIKQNYVPVNDSTWLIFSQKFTFDFDLLGFSFGGNYLGIYSDYEVESRLNKVDFDNEMLRVEKEATEKDSLYWAKNRPVKLLPEEEEDYELKDSLSEVYASESFLDSLDADENKPTVGKLLLWGYEYQKSYENYSIQVDPLIFSLQYNTVEGAVLDLDLSVRRWYEERGKETIYAEPYIRYGFANGHLNAGVEIGRGGWSIGGGKDVKQFNDWEPITNLANSIYTLFVEENHMKTYEKTYLNVGYSDELINGIEPAVVAEYAQRSPLHNTTDFTLIDYEDRSFTPNQPRHQTVDTQSFFPGHRAFIIEAAVQFKFKQKYITLPHRTIRLGSKYPKLVVFYKKGIEDIGQSAVNFDYLGAKVYDQMDYGILGYGKYAARGGLFLNKNQTYLMDYYHFNGNRTIFANDYMNGFQLMNYYENSTTDPFVQLHYEHHFKGFIFNKIPLIRNLKWNVVGGLHYLYTEDLPHYWEANVGVENIFKISNIKLGRLDFYTAFQRQQPLNSGLRLKLDITSEFISIN